AARGRGCEFPAFDLRHHPPVIKETPSGIRWMRSRTQQLHAIRSYGDHGIREQVVNDIVAELVIGKMLVVFETAPGAELAFLLLDVGADARKALLALIFGRI